MAKDLTYDPYLPRYITSWTIECIYGGNKLNLFELVNLNNYQRSCIAELYIYSVKKKTINIIHMHDIPVNTTCMDSILR